MENKKNKILLAIGISALAILIIGATYAYFQNQYGDASQADVKVMTYTTDVLTFETGDDISITADQENFAQGKGNQTGSTYASALLRANNKTNTATANYYVYLNITNNEFVYTIDENTPELLLTITDDNGNEITDISGLNYVSVTDGNGEKVSGYDITEASGLLTLFNNREIIASPEKEEKWNIKVTFINYDKDQSKNAGNSLTAKIMIQKDVAPYHISCNDDSISCHVAKMYTGTQGENGLYYHNSSLENGAGDNSYRFAGGDYILTDTGKATGATMMIAYNNSVTTALIDIYCNNKREYVGENCSTLKTIYYLIKGETTQYQTYGEALNASVEKGYLSKDNIKNFVCFGSTKTPCPTENLYRIIGVFNNQVKLIKWNYATSDLLGTDGDFPVDDTTNYSTSFYSGNQVENKIDKSMLFYWNNSTKKNTWSESDLNQVNLNTNFLSNIGEEWANKIVQTTWKVGGNTYANIATSPMFTAYQNEILTPSIGSESTTGETEYTSKIGLMYVSDYGYAASPSAWTLTGKNYNYLKAENWLYGGLKEWTISRSASSSNIAFYVDYSGVVHNYFVDSSLTIYCIRPSFSLEASVTYKSGIGTKDSPIILGD